MKVVLTLAASGDPEVVDAQVSYHLSAGVDLVLTNASEMAAKYSTEGRIHFVRSDSQTTMARLAATEHGADWVINAAAGEFWWPRAESLRDVLAPIPPRYTIVQGLRRPFVPRSGEGSFSERMTVRRSFEDMPRNGRGSYPAVLRPVHRADPKVVVRQDGTIELDRHVPLRAWYPLEVFHFPAGRAHEGAAEEGSLVEDTRLRDALRGLREGAGSMLFRTPDVVDDAAYAVECAAVGEVDLIVLEEYVSDLERRIATLEQRFWPRVLRAASRRLSRPAR